MSETFTEGVEQLHSDAAALPSLLDDAVTGTASFAAALSEHVLNLDARRSALNQQAQQLGVPPVADVVTGCVPAEDAVRARLIAAARLGAGELAVGLGKAARGPAGLPGAAAPLEAGAMGDAARAAAALMTWVHHEVEDVEPADLVAGADPLKAAMLLAGIAVKLAGDAMAGEEAVSAWIVSLGAAWAGDD